MYCSNIKKSISTIVKKKLIKRDTLTICQKKIALSLHSRQKLTLSTSDILAKSMRGKSTHKHNKFNVNKYISLHPRSSIKCRSRLHYRAKNQFYVYTIYSKREKI